jgi:hypothetical protein
MELLNKRLFPFFPKLVRFSSQSIEIRENYVFSESAFPEFDSNSEMESGSIVINFLGKKPRRLGSEHHERLRCAATRRAIWGNLRPKAPWVCSAI